MKTIAFFISFLTLICMPEANGQKAKKMVKVSGLVTYFNQRPVAGAIIIVDNQNTGTTTSNKGFYKVKVKADAKMIGVLSTSGEIIESAINGQSEINFTYSDKVFHVSPAKQDYKVEEDVNIGYGTINKRDLLTPVGKIDGTHSRYSSYMSIYDMLRGQPGVQVNGRSVIIQGISTFYGSTEPLYVLDGTIVSTIDGIPPQMVKSIEILKGPSASIYGSRGANGVILVTLIKAKK